MCNFYFIFCFRVLFRSVYGSTTAMLKEIVDASIPKVLGLSSVVPTPETGAEAVPATVVANVREAGGQEAGSVHLKCHHQLMHFEYCRNSADASHPVQPVGPDPSSSSASSDGVGSSAMAPSVDKPPTAVLPQGVLCLDRALLIAEGGLNLHSSAFFAGGDASCYPSPVLFHSPAATADTQNKSDKVSPKRKRSSTDDVDHALAASLGTTLNCVLSRFALAIYFFKNTRRMLC